MSYEVLEQRIKALPSEYFIQISRYIDALWLQINAKQEKKKRCAGGLSGQFEMSEDFDEIPEGFEEYI